MERSYTMNGFRIQRTAEQKFTILLLTNRDSDNLGDQVIEACDIGLLHAAMRNLGISKGQYKIVSKQAAIVSEKYVRTRDKSLLENARDYVKNCDIVVFGGAPMFNYHYQIFYERTATICELAQEYHKPVIFSAIGIEKYDDENEKCQRLKQAINLECVKQITTRDGFEELKKYRERDDIHIAKVSDPAVFTRNVFAPYIADKSRNKVGIFILRANGFVDNGVPFTQEQAADLWIQLGSELERRDVEYEYVTSGHFGDEAFLDYLIRERGVPENKCVFNMNFPEQLIRKISSYDVILSTRLHPSIISYSLGVPSVGLVWNEKVRRFYENIGQADRVKNVNEVRVKELADLLMNAEKQGINRNTDYMMTVYQSLFTGLQQCLEESDVICKNLENRESYGYQELEKKLPAYPKTSEKQEQEKLRRKFRRVYHTCNKRLKRISKFTVKDYVLRYHSGVKGDDVQPITEYCDILDGEMKRLESGALEITLYKHKTPASEMVFPDSCFQYAKHKFKGWVLRFRCGKCWYWILEDGSFCDTINYKQGVSKEKMLFHAGDQLPDFAIPDIHSVVVEARWK